MYSMEYLWNKLWLKMRGRAIHKSNIHKTSKIGEGSQIVNVVMGRHSFCGYDCKIVNCDIGSFCSLACNVSIGLASHPIEWVSTSPAFLEPKDSIRKKYSKHPYESGVATEIGNDVWIGEGAYIKAGVKIGDGAVIGMGSVVTKDVPNYAIVGGAPAKLLRMRFEQDVIDSLNKREWWTWSDEKITKYAPYFTDVKVFLERTEDE